MPKKSDRRPGRGVGPRARPLAGGQTINPDSAIVAGSDAPTKAAGSSTTKPIDPEVQVSIDRLFSFIAWQIAADILRDRRKSSRKGT